MVPAKEGRVEVATFDQYTWDTWAVRRHIVPLLRAVRLRDLSAEVVDAWIGELRAETERPATPRADLGPARAQGLLDGARGGGPAKPDAVEPGGADPAAPPGPDPEEARLDTRRSPTVPQGGNRASPLRRLPPRARHRPSPGRGAGPPLGRRRPRAAPARGRAATLGRAGPAVTQAAQDRVQRPGGHLRRRHRRSARRHRALQQAEAEFIGPAWRETGLVFTTPLGGWIDPNNFGRAMDALVDKRVPRITPKGMRHTAQSIGRVVVGDDKVMQERLGHSDIGITLNTYTHTVTEQHREAGRRLDRVFSALGLTRTQDGRS